MLNTRSFLQERVTSQNWWSAPRTREDTEWASIVWPLDHWGKFSCDQPHLQLRDVPQAAWCCKRAENGRSTERLTAPWILWLLAHQGRPQEVGEVLSTCMASRAIHLETANFLETESLKNALRYLLDRRGLVRQIRSDRGTSFIGATRELQEAVERMNHSHVR